MSHADRAVYNVKPSFHPVSHYGCPDDVLNDVRLSTEEKRVVLSSWASDMYVVDSQPTLREIPGIPHRLHLDDILSALKQLDGDPDPSGGGLAMRRPRSEMLDDAIAEEPRSPVDSTRHRTIRTFRNSNHRRWTREENIRRYRKLLNTQLTSMERDFIERRLTEELRG
jgi:hypothetical protein